MDEAKVIGVVHLVEGEKTFGSKGFRKRLVVLEQEDGRFPNYVPIEFTQDNCSLADGLKVGEEIEVTYRLKGRRWDKGGEVKYFCNVEAVSVKKLSGGHAGGNEAGGGRGGDEGDGGFDDDVPF